MNVDSATIDDIVKQVMEQLSSRFPAGSSSAPKPTVAPAPVSAPSIDRLVLSERVITGALLVEKLRQEKTLIVSPKAVLTPTAVELLKQRQVRCLREDISSAKAGSAGVRWRLIRSTTDAEVERCTKEITAKSPGVSTQLVGCPDDCVRQAVAILSRAEVDGIIALVRDPWSVACRANRQSKIRAAVLTHAASLEDIRRQLGANLLCVNPVGRPYFELRNLLTAAVGIGLPTAPQGWRD